MIEETSRLWQYFSPTQRTLARDGEFLVTDSERHTDEEPTDYSYLVFPFAKLYEGFLKQLFLDIGVIRLSDYMSERFRLGKALSPHLVSRLRGRSVYGQLRERYGDDLAETLWRAWKNGRNLVFHYFPHNYRALSRAQAQTVVSMLVDAMSLAIEKMNPKK